MTPTNRKLYLASQSPRRRQMMGWLGIPCALTAAEVDETPLPGERPAHLAARLARAKARLAAEEVGGHWVLAADTVVNLDGTSLGKPVNDDEAWQMLRALRDREHQVHTAVALAAPGGDITARRVTTRVWMRAYTDADIAGYIATGDPMDKAGAYAIQHVEFHPVSRLDACYANVVGLPFGAAVRLLRDAGWLIDVNIPDVCERHFGFRCDPPDEGEPV